jgi:5-oxopent-3-ene-1,2,5-tricarboxylate decarboxylase/2-hydroxyhepta-2,4-diene-1,7-dioate isomerase
MLAIDSLPSFEAPPRGTVYGTLLNFRGALAALGDSVNQPPLKAPPRAPILYIKPRNTFAVNGDEITVPAGVEALEIGATLALVIGRTACRVSVADALSFVAGYAVACDVSVPHAPYYRPALRHKCRDGFCPIGTVVERTAVANPDDLTIRVEIDGREVQCGHTAELIRPVARLLADVTEFMTLEPGDLLMVGVPEAAPQARAGQQVRLHIDGVGDLNHTLVAEGGHA